MKKITIITPYYKGERSIFKTIDSVKESFLNVEKYIDLTYIVVIDSMEDKDRIKERLSKTYGDFIQVKVNKTNLGVATTRNKTLRELEEKFDYIIFLDQDDLLDQEYFKCILEKTSSNPEMIVTNAYVVNEKNNKKVKMYYKKPDLSFEQFLNGNKILTPGQVVFSQKVCKIKDLFAECSKDFKGADDWASYLNIFLKFSEINIEYVEKPIFYYNIHETNYSNNWKELNLSAIKTAEFFKEKVKNERKRKLLDGTIEFLEFENRYKDDNYTCNISDFKLIIKYNWEKFSQFNKVMHFINKKRIGFYK